jgi:transcriptional regulator with GAF, ATPase, and Fis domain
MRKSSTLGRVIAQESLEVQPMNYYHQDVDSQSTIRPNGSGLNHITTTTQLTRPEAFSSIIFASHAINEIINKIERARDITAPMLITGETGTGKELIARAAHSVSPRHEREFIPFNCGGMAPELIASELFGYRRGAFTGADRDYKGIIREASGGTLLLDEIGDLSLAAQPKLLRFLQESEVRSLGEARPTRVNVRVIAATNRNLEEDVLSGRFRADLYHRLNVFRVHIPPLRERREDIRPLINHFLNRCCRKTDKQWLRLSDEAWGLIFDYHWPGNVREVENLVRRLAASAVAGEVIERKNTLDAIQAGTCSPPQRSAVTIEGCGLIDINLPLHEAMDELKRLLIVYALKVTSGNLTQAATNLKIHRDGLRKMINRLKIKVEKGDRRK